MASDVYVHRCSRQNTHPFNGPFSGTTQVSRYQKGKTNLDFTEARDSEWQWHQLGHMQVCTSLQTDNHASTPPLGCPSCHPTNSIKAVVRTVYSNSKGFEVKVGMHQGTALSTLLFMIVMEAIQQQQRPFNGL